MSDSRILVAVDAGGSATRAIVVTEDGTILGTGRGGPGNQVLSGWETVQASLHGSIDAALRAARIDAGRVGVLSASSAGVGAKGELRESVEEVLRQACPGAARIEVAGDMLAALWGALQDPVGVVATAGTGSVCFGRNEAGDVCQVGGWGHVMGDEGSAYDIAVQALRAVARAADGRSPATSLTSALASAVDGETTHDVAVAVYGRPLARDEIAALAVRVVAEARKGDAAAREIVAGAAAELARAVSVTLEKLNLAAAPAMVSYAGSVFDAGDVLLGPFRDSIRRSNPAARVTAPLLPPIGGAFRLGLRALGADLSPAVTSRLRAQLEALR